MSRRTVSIDWASRADILTAPLSPEQASGVAVVRALKAPRTTVFDHAVLDFLARGSPRLALAKALGIPLEPLVIVVDPMTVATGAGSSRTQPVSVDTLVERMDVRIRSSEPTIGMSTGSWLNDTATLFDARLDVGGPKGYAFTNGYVPIVEVVNSFNAAVAAWAVNPLGMVLHRGQCFETRVRARHALSQPAHVTFSWRAWQPAWQPGDAFAKLSDEDVVRKLEALGYEIPRAS